MKTDIEIQVPKVILKEIWAAEEKGDDVRHVFTITKPEGYKNYLVRLETYDGDDIVGGQSYYSGNLKGGE